MRIISYIFILSLLLLPAAVSAQGPGPDHTFDDAFLDSYGSDDAEFYDYPEDEEDGQLEEIYDPIEPWNRLVFGFNDKFYVYIFKPVAKTYNAILLEDIRISARNFFDNIETPVRLVNNLLQLKIKRAGTELARFGVNSTLGIFGIFDVAEKQLDLKKHDEDFGQTLGAFGLGNGIYIVWPLIGPSSLLDTIGRVGDVAISPIDDILDDETYYAVTAYKYLNSGSLKMEYYDDLKESAIDPYTAFKDAYYQYRQEQIKK